ncbi:hypothetical protein V1503_22410 [Bacillus sp. SCS-151]|uniref:hypothetical protein n=1 Tax=Nanhaiella sioensis TaxID=3115293 RepID=UPI00397B6DC5
MQKKYSMTITPDTKSITSTWNLRFVFVHDVVNCVTSLQKRFFLNHPHEIWTRIKILWAAIDKIEALIKEFFFRFMSSLFKQLHYIVQKDAINKTAIITID